jgi:hypothetical protein
MADPFSRDPKGSADAIIEETAWEEIESGRFRPRRVRGSYHGRELG